MSGRRLREFLRQNPFCIFCGGATPATTQDHVPSRQLFTDRWWPEGYVFPACVACNQSTRRAEQVVALLSRFGPGIKSPREETEFKDLLKAMVNNDPEVLWEMYPTESQMQELSSKPWAGSLINSGQIAPRPLFVSGPRLTAYMRDYARKLFCALHYKEFATILTASGGISWRWFSNVQSYDGEIPNIISEFTKIPVIKRTSRNLGDQFSYAFEMATDGEAAGYFAVFRHSFAIIGIVDAQGTYPELSSPAPGILKPLSPASHDAAGAT